mgnify:CR=1 FL=1
MKLHYKISGEGTPLIILHGLFGTLDNWASQVTTLAQHFQVISVDLRNHGQSPHHKDMNHSTMAEDDIELRIPDRLPSSPPADHQRLIKY